MSCRFQTSRSPTLHSFHVYQTQSRIRSWHLRQLALVEDESEPGKAIGIISTFNAEDLAEDLF